jgi:cbb3-type cytochrome oxidase cytochrome c subunit
MKGLAPLFLGIFGTFAFSWIGLTVLPNWQIGHLNPQSDEEGTDIYPQPQSGMVERGARVYAANGCAYCHTQQVRADYAGSDIERKWGIRRSAPRDYIFEQPVFLAKMRMGQDIANIGARAPAEQESPAPAGGAPPAASPAPPQGAAGSKPPPPQTGSPSPKTSPAAQGAGAPPAPAGSPAKQAAAAAQSPAGASPSPAGSSATAQPPNAGAAPAKSPAPPTVVASPSPGAMAPGAVSAGMQPGTPTAPSSGPQSAGPPWPEQTIGLPPMYSAEWHHVHLYSPRSINFDSNMPSYRFLYQKRRISDARSSDALHLTGSDAPPEGWEIVPSYDAKCLVAYMMALNQSHPLSEARSAGGGPPPAATAPAAAPSPAAAASPAPAK